MLPLRAPRYRNVVSAAINQSDVVLALFVNLKGKALRHVAVVGDSRIRAEIPDPDLDLICFHLPPRTSLSIVGGSLGPKELLADLDILGLPLLDTHIKVRRIAAVKCQR